MCEGDMTYNSVSVHPRTLGPFCNGKANTPQYLHPSLGVHNLNPINN